MPSPTLHAPGHRLALRCRRVLPGVVLGVGLVQLLAFTLSAIHLSRDLYGHPQHFSDATSQPSLMQLLWANLDLAWGYGLVGLGMILLAWPLIQWANARLETFRTRKIVGQAALITAGVWVFFAVKFFFAQPFYFLSDPGYQDIAYRVTNFVPSWVKFAVFEAFPCLITAGLATHYLARLLKWKMPHWPGAAAQWVSLLTIALVSLVTWVSVSWPKSPPLSLAPARPNVLILASDSLRADHLSNYGYARPTTPAIAALAARSTQFSQCYVPIASTLESVTSLMSGQYPHTHGLQHAYPNRGQVEHVKLNSPTLAGQFAAAGYETTVLGDWCAGVFSKLPHGFANLDIAPRNDYKVHLAQMTYRDHPLLPIFFGNEIGFSMFPSLRSLPEAVTPEVVTERLKVQITKQAGHEQPFFITALFSNTHLPYNARPPYNRIFKSGAADGPHRGGIAFDVDQFLKTADPSQPLAGLSEFEAAQITDLYDGCVTSFDARVREVLEHLEKTGLAEHTIVLVTSDHGDSLLEANSCLGHGRAFNGKDPDLHIPCVLYVPGRETEARCVNHLVRSIDFAPTLLDLAGLPADARMEGVSLKPYVEQPGANLALAVFAETSEPFAKRSIPGEIPLLINPPAATTAVDLSFDGHEVLLDAYQEEILKTKERCLRTQYWKLVFSPGRDRDIWRLFDLRRDPNCEHPVNFTYPGVFSSMQKSLLTWMREKKESRIGDIFPDGEPTDEVVSNQ